MTKHLTQCEGQGLPQGLGTPYYYYHSLLPTTRGDLHIMGYQGACSVSGSEPSDTPQPTTPGDGMMPELDGLDFHPTCTNGALRHEHPVKAAYAVRWAKRYQPKLGTDVWFMCAPCYQAGVAVMDRVNAPCMWRVVDVLS